MLAPPASCPFLPTIGRLKPSDCDLRIFPAYARITELEKRSSVLKSSAFLCIERKIDALFSLVGLTEDLHDLFLRGGSGAGLIASAHSNIQGDLLKAGHVADEIELHHVGQQHGVTHTMGQVMVMRRTARAVGTIRPATGVGASRLIGARTSVSAPSLKF